MFPHLPTSGRYGAPFELWPPFVLEAAGREAGQRALLGDAEDGLDGVRDSWRGERKVREARSEARNQRREVREAIHEAEGVVLGLAEAVAVVVGEKFGLIGGDVDVDGALALAGFAGEAEVEGFAYAVVVPVRCAVSGADDFALSISHRR